MSNPTHTITAGPDRYNFQEALFSAQHPRPAVEFSVREFGRENGQQWKEQIHINGVSLEDGSGYRFCFEGYNSANSARLKGYYDLRTKSGWIEFAKRK